ncbi:glutathione S-transferase C-terminal domain-containing protein [Streptomyces sp. 4N509B]|uniref:glutathione S-transferase C-terminal domain-containing protein n=1 Tax=Streptomyces sp. 4N509B TaxID=3457413 RepID=UPI003FD6B195
MSATSSNTPHAFRGRIGRDARGGFHAAPHRFHLYLTLSCPHCLRIAIAYDLLRLHDRVRLTLLPPVPDPTGGYAVLRTAYEATEHRVAGPAVAPALVDTWTGRVVSNHAPDILADLATHFGDDGPRLFPDALDEDIAMVAELCEHGIVAAAQRAGQPASHAPLPSDPDPFGDHRGRQRALDTLLTVLCALEDRLARGHAYLLGHSLTAADLHLWVTLVELDTVHRWHLDVDAVHRVAGHRQLWAYAHRMLVEPAFRRRLRVADITARHRHVCRGQEAAGAAVQIIDWTTSGVPSPAPHHR